MTWELLVVLCRLIAVVAVGSTEGLCCSAGRAVDVLQILSQLPELKTLDLGHQHLSGTLPTNVSFASLTTLRLTNTHITVSCTKLIPIPPLAGLSAWDSALYNM